MGWEKYENMQYIWLRDKNNKEIFEWDIVIVKNIPYGKTNRGNYKEEAMIWDVIYHEWLASFRIRTKHFGSPSIGESNTMRFRGSEYQELEVIGNIFENPELLNGL